MSRARSKERAAAATEMILVAVLVALSSIGAYRAFGQSARAAVCRATATLSDQPISICQEPSSIDALSPTAALLVAPALDPHLAAKNRIRVAQLGLIDENDPFSPFGEPHRDELPLPQPPLSADKRNLGDWTAYYPPAPPGTLFGKSGLPSAGDAIQGRLGNCWFVATMNAIALEQPEALKARIRDLHNGHYEITTLAEGKPTVLAVVDANVPYWISTQEYALYTRRRDGVMWGQLLEKAYATAYRDKGGYEAFITRLAQPDVFDGLLGSETRIHVGLYTLPEADETAENRAAREAQNQEDLARAAALLRMAKQSRWPTTVSFDGQIESEVLESHRIHSNHAYIFADIRIVHGEPMVLLANPWGDEHPRAHVKPNEPNSDMERPQYLPLRDILPFATISVATLKISKDAYWEAFRAHFTQQLPPAQDEALPDPVPYPKPVEPSP